jgi:hypothetical protein
LRFDLEQSFDNIAISVFYFKWLECIREHFISGEAALVNEHGGWRLQKRWRYANAKCGGTMMLEAGVSTQQKPPTMVHAR